MELNEFDDLINLGRVVRTVKLLDREIVLTTLNSREYSAAMSRVPQSVSDADKFEAMQRELVTASIKSIDGKELTTKEKSLIVAAGQLGLSNLLYSEYMMMADEQGRLLEDAKKNSSRAMTPLTESQTARASS